MEQSPKHARTPQAGAGGAHGRVTEKAKNRRPVRKIFDQKSEVCLVPGAPEIAHPIKREAYERQIAGIYAWFIETLERSESMDVETANAARGELQTLQRTLVKQLLRIALKSTRGDARRWAGQMLAMLFVTLEKHNGKRAKRDDGPLSRANRAYCEVRAKLRKLRSDVLFPGPVGKAVQRELKKAENYRRRLLVFKEAYGEGWKAAVGGHNIESRQKIPEEYWAFVDLLDFSPKLEAEWWKSLWPLIKKNNSALLEELRGGKFPTRGIRYQSRWASYRKEFRNGRSSRLGGCLLEARFGSNAANLGTGGK
jgi:hypothetical protein